MQRWTSLAVMMLVLAGVLVAGHYYLWARLIRDPGFGCLTRQAIIGLICTLAVSFPLAVITASSSLPGCPPGGSRQCICGSAARSSCFGSTAPGSTAPRLMRAG